VSKIVTAEVSPLFAQPPRWGYEYVAPLTPTESPERNNSPSPRQVRRVPRSQAAGLREAGTLAAIGGVGVLYLDAKLGVLSGGTTGTVAGVAVVFVHLVAAAVAYWAALAWNRSSTTGGGHAVRRTVVPWLNAVATFFAPYIVLPVEAVIAWRRIWAGRQDLVPDPSDTRRAKAEYEEAMEAWEERVTQFEEAETRRSESVNTWFPVPLSQAARMTCIFGGTSVSWTAALSTLGASLLGAGSRIVIGDLSRRLTADVLCDLSRAAGITPIETVLPRDAANGELLTGMDWRDLSSVLVEVLHSAQQDLDVSRREREMDQSVILDVADCLNESGLVSVTRLRRAFLIVRGSAVTEETFDAGECERLRALGEELQRQHVGVAERVSRIERALRAFELLDAAEPQASSDPSDLQVIRVQEQTDDLENERLVDLLFYLLLYRVRRGKLQTDVLIILGADRIRREALESLITQAEQQDIKVLLFFEHLRHYAVDIVGGGGATAVFMTLGNHREAKEASDFIGGEYKWVEAQHTASASKSLTQTPSVQVLTARSVTGGLPPTLTVARTKTEGRSYSEAFGQQLEYTRAEQRVREAVIEPEILMGLPATGMICVEVQPGGQRTAVNIDCHPQIVFAPRVDKEPRTRPAA
jgi:hypothetical protein